MTDRTLVIACGHELSLALLEGNTVLGQLDMAMQRGHAEAIVPAIARLLAPFGGRQADCARVVVETGPGSFTGLRIGLAAASALALAWKAALVGVRSTQLVAADMRSRGEERELLVLLAAPRGQVWLEKFAAASLCSTLPAVALAPADARQLALTVPLLAGSAITPLGLAGIQVQPRAAAVAAMPAAAFGRAEPHYVRISDGSTRC